MLLSNDVRTRLSDACNKMGSQNAWAKTHGISQAYVNDVLQGRREPGLTILRALGLERLMIYDRPEAIARIVGRK